MRRERKTIPYRTLQRPTARASFIVYTVLYANEDRTGSREMLQDLLSGILLFRVVSCAF